MGIHVDDVTAEIVDAAIGLHRDLGPGLLESVYQHLLADELARRNLDVSQNVALNFEFRGRHFPGMLRIDLLVSDLVIVELKSVETIAAVHMKQLLTYLRLHRSPVGLLLNFGAATMKEGIRRVVNIAAW